MIIAYLDQNYVSRIAKFLMGQSGHEVFGELYTALQGSAYIFPASPFHVLELQGGYLLPGFQEIFGQLSKGYWVYHWQEVLAHQLQHERLSPEDLIYQKEDPSLWEQEADLSPLEDMVDLPLEGSLNARTRQAQGWLRGKLDITAQQTPPFLDTLSRCLAFRSLNTERQPHDSDLADLVITATVHPYVTLFGTDRFVREALDRMGMGEGVYSGRTPDLRKLIARLGEDSSTI